MGVADLALAWNQSISRVGIYNGNALLQEAGLLPTSPTPSPAPAPTVSPTPAPTPAPTQAGIPLTDPAADMSQLAAEAVLLPPSGDALLGAASAFGSNIAVSTELVAGGLPDTLLVSSGGHFSTESPDFSAQHVSVYKWTNTVSVPPPSPRAAVSPPAPVACLAEAADRASTSPQTEAYELQQILQPPPSLSSNPDRTYFFGFSAAVKGAQLPRASP